MRLWVGPLFNALFNFEGPGTRRRQFAPNVRRKQYGVYKGSTMRRAAGVFEKRWTQTYSTDERQALCETWGCSSAGRAPALQAGGRQFDSVHLHQLHWRQFAPTDRCNENCRDQEGTKRSSAKHRSADRWQGHGRPQKWAHSSGG